MSLARGWRALAAGSVFSLCGAGMVSAQPALPTPLKDVGYDQRLGEQVPLDLPFRDESGKTVRLGDYFGERPVVFVLAYYTCPMLCGVVLDAVAGSLRVVSFEPGRDYDVVVASFDPHDLPAAAAAKKRDILARYGRPAGAGGWHFLTGGEASIAALTRAVGFRYYFDQDTRQYAHAAGMVLLTPQGKIARYFYGVDFPPRDVRLGLVEASGEKIGSLVDQVLLYCFHYNPVVGRYSAVTLNVVRLGGIATVLGIALMVVMLHRRESALPEVRQR